MVPHSLADLLLRLAEPPSLYQPRWTDDILDEVHRNHVRKGLPPDRADSFRRAVNEAFPEATITEYQPLIAVCTNDEKDRHVLAAAIRGKVQTIVTDNVRDFPPESLRPWDVEVVRAGDYLASLYELSPAVVIAKLDDSPQEESLARGESAVLQ